MQTLLFNTTTKEVKLYADEKHSSKMLEMYTHVPTVRISEHGYYEDDISQNDVNQNDLS